MDPPKKPSNPFSYQVTGPVLYVKGAPESILERCSSALHWKWQSETKLSEGERASEIEGL